ncbi:MAG: Trk system potassium transporter TrkA [Muribaculaceae bacterium]|nr:Trk system potassium transporter TrkA [Muribaculaceae bacterium]
MKIVIAGAGEVGTHLAKLLSNEEQDIILLDSDQSRLDVINENYNLMTWNGSTSSFETLRDVGVSSSDLYIAVTPFETRNITSCAIAKRLGAKKTMARIDNHEFLREKNGRILKDIGVDNLIYPEELAADEIARSLAHNWASYWGELNGGKLLLIGVRLHNDNALINHKLKDLPVKTHDFHVAAIKRHNTTIIPGGNDEILYDDTVYFITTPPFVQEVMELCGKKKRVIRKAFIVGGSRITIRFAKRFHDKYHIKIIDSNREHCEALATMLPNCEIVFGDGRDIEVLKENDVDQYDAFLSLTSSSETNILTCMSAKEFGVPKTIADVENLQFVSQAENLNIGTIINKKILASSHIFKILLDADDTNSKCLALADAEVAEMMVRKGAKITKAAVKDLRLPPGMTLAAVVRNNQATLVGGNTRIEAGDFVVVFCLNGTISKIEKWFY